MTTIKIINEDLLYLLPDAEYLKDWLDTDNLACKIPGDQLSADHKFSGVKVRSAVNQSEYNILLDPLYPGYHDLSK